MTQGIPHTIQGLEDENEYLLVFDDGDFDATGYITRTISSRCCHC